MTETNAQNKSARGECHIVLRDITKAFDKVWHPGMKSKILNLKLPVILEKFLCDFLDERRTRISVGTFLGESFDLQCGVPSGSVLSPTLLITCTHDILLPLRATNISYADDISQIVGYQGKSLAMAQRTTAREIIIIDEYEEKWRIKTN